MSKRSSERQEDEYARLMGLDALARQKVTKPPKRGESPKCNCGWKLEKGSRIGPHHEATCPLYSAAE